MILLALFFFLLLPDARKNDYSRIIFDFCVMIYMKDKLNAIYIKFKEYILKESFAIIKKKGSSILFVYDLHHHIDCKMDNFVLLVHIVYMLWQCIIKKLVVML